MQNAPSSSSSSSRKNTYDVIWRQHVLGLVFTPNERDQPVICQVPETSSPDVLQSPASVGDILVALQPRNAPVELVKSFHQVIKVLQRGELPIALRFVSRQKDVPERVVAADVVATYTFVWQAQHPLGVSLAMDPCSLHTAITRIDAQKISPDFQQLDPHVGDILVGVRSTVHDSSSVQLDAMRFEDIIRTLREVPRPAQLTFARLVEDSDAGASVQSSPPAMSHHSAASHEQQQQQQDGAVLLRQQHPRLRPAPFASRQSFRIETRAQANDVAPPASLRSVRAVSAPAPPSSSSSKSNKSDNKFYKVIYSGGAIGLQLRDCSHEDKKKKQNQKKEINKTKTKGYSVCIKDVTDAQSAPGLENASAGDLLMAIGPLDLQFQSFELVQQQLNRIHSRTELLFKKRASESSSGGSLVDALFLFLI